MIYFLVILLNLTNTLIAQDEKYVNDLLKGNFNKNSRKYQLHKGPGFEVLGPKYAFDLNENTYEEYFQISKADGQDVLTLYDAFGNQIFKHGFTPKGVLSHIYALRIIKVSPKLKVVLIYHNEGTTEAKFYEKTSSLHLISFENNDLTNISLTKGAMIFHENEKHREQYFQRDLKVDVVDLNKDGVSEIAIHFNGIQRIFTYKNNQWLLF